jgi:acyl-coenzyme A synthetase/AMP-(fatty) acid ligase
VGAAPGAGEGLERVPDRRHPVPLGLAGTLGGPAGGQVAALAGLGAATHGYLFVVDRLKELIKYKGYQVAPAELEHLLLTHPAVADAAVVPRPDPEAGEVPVAHVALRGQATAEELLAYVAERVAPHKKIRQVEFVDEIPKAASGKILRRVLMERDQAAG